MHQEPRAVDLLHRIPRPRLRFDDTHPRLTPVGYVDSAAPWLLPVVQSPTSRTRIPIGLPSVYESYVHEMEALRPRVRYSFVRGTEPLKRNRRTALVFPARE
jgi:hypothetical protein